MVDHCRYCTVLSSPNEQPVKRRYQGFVNGLQLPLASWIFCIGNNALLTELKREWERGECCIFQYSLITMMIPFLLLFGHCYCFVVVVVVVIIVVVSSWFHEFPNGPLRIGNQAA